jgi:hypothetical protein
MIGCNSMRLRLLVGLAVIFFASVARAQVDCDVDGCITDPFSWFNVYSSDNAAPQSGGSAGSPGGGSSSGSSGVPFRYGSPDTTLAPICAPANPARFSLTGPPGPAEMQSVMNVLANSLLAISMASGIVSMGVSSRSVKSHNSTFGQAAPACKFINYYAAPASIQTRS